MAGRDVRVGAYGYHFPPFERAVDSAIAAEKAGLNFVVYGDQLSFSHPEALWTDDITTMAGVLDADAFLDPGVIAVAAAPRTGAIQFCLGPMDVVRRAPNVLAQYFASISHATAGRTTFAISNGENKQMKPYGISRRGASDKLWDAAHIIRLLLDSCEPVHYSGRVWNLENARLPLPATGEAQAPFVIAGGSAESLELAGSVADGWMALAPGHLDDDVNVFKLKVATLREHAERVGRDPGALKVYLIAMCVSLEDQDQLGRLRDHPLVRWSALPATSSAATFARWNVTHPISDDWTYSRDCIPWLYNREEVLGWCDQMPREAVEKARFIGHPTAVQKRLEPYLEAGLVTDIVIANLAPLCGLEFAADAARSTQSIVNWIQHADGDPQALPFAGLV